MSSTLPKSLVPFRADSLDSRQRIQLIFQDALHTPLPEPHTDLIATGLLDSLALVTLLVELEQAFSITVPLDNLDIENLRTIEHIAAFVEESCAASTPVTAPLVQRRVVLLRAGTADRPIVLVHTVMGEAVGMRPLAAALDTDRSVYGLQARGLDPGEEPQRRVEEMAKTYVDAITSLHPDGPFSLAGSSFGGLIAFEMARLLHAAGKPVPCLALIDPLAHHNSLPALARKRFLLIRPFRYLRYILSAPRKRVPSYLRKAILRVVPRIPLTPPAPEQTVPPEYRRIEQAATEAFKEYRPGDYVGDAMLFVADERPHHVCNPLSVWSRKVLGVLSVERLTGGHYTISNEANVKIVASQLSKQLAERPPPTRFPRDAKHDALDAVPGCPASDPRSTARATSSTRARETRPR